MDLTWQLTKLSFLRLPLSHSPRASFITVKHRNTCKLSLSFIWVDLTAVHFSAFLITIARDQLLPIHHGIKFSVWTFCFANFTFPPLRSSRTPPPSEAGGWWSPRRQQRGSPEPGFFITWGRIRIFDCMGQNQDSVTATSVSRILRWTRAGQEAFPVLGLLCEERCKV